MNKKKKETNWWKVLIVLTFLVSLIILCILTFDIREKVVIKSGTFSTSSTIFNKIERFHILESVCVDARLYYPLIEPDKIWVEKTTIKKGYCHLIYEDKVKIIRFTFQEESA